MPRYLGSARRSRGRSRDTAACSERIRLSDLDNWDGLSQGCGGGRIMTLSEEGSGMKRDSEVLLMRRERAIGRSREQAAARAGMSVRTLRRYERRGKLPSQFQEPRTYLTRPSPFAEDWTWIASQLEND